MLEAKKVFGGQNCWECKMLGVQNCGENKNVGKSKLLGDQECWEAKNVRSTKVLGVQNCWEIGNNLNPDSISRGREGHNIGICDYLESIWHIYFLCTSLFCNCFTF